MKILINNEEVLSNKNFTIKEEMLNTSSVILNNVYPKSWEQTKDYTSQFYYPKDYSKCKIIDEEYHPAEEGIYVEGTNLTLTDVDTTKLNELTDLKGNTTQSGTPTPSSPQPINVVSGRQEIDIVGKNLLDISDITTTSYITNNGNGTITLNGTGSGGVSFSLTKPFTLKANTTYTLSLTNTNSSYSAGTFILRNGNTNIFLINYNVSSVSYTPTQDIVIDVLRIFGGGVSFDNFTFSVQLEKGSTPSEYEAYKGQSYEINLGKNLFNINDFFSKHQSITIENNSIILGNVAYQPIVYVLRIENNKTYTISFNSSTTNVYRLQVKDSDSSGTSGTTLLNKSITSLSYSGNFTTTSEYIRIEFFQSTSTETQIISNIQLEKGGIATTYAPYKTPIDLCKIGTYQDRIYKENGTWYLHKEIGKVVLNGSENWSFAGSITNNISYQLILKNDMPFTATDIFYNALNNYYKYVQQSLYKETDTNKSGLFTCLHSGNNLVLRLVNKDTTTVADFKTWLQAHNISVYYILATPTTTEITDTELISQLNAIELLEGLNNISITSAYLPGTIRLHYNFTNEQIIETLLFCGIVKNTGNISLNPREPHYCSLQILDFKNFLSQGETLDFVIANKTILEAIEQIISTISGYGFVLGNVDILGSYDMIGAYSTKDKTAYDVFNYIADITQSRWTTRMINENQVAIDFYDPTLMPEGTAIEYTKEWFETNNINDMSFSYSSNDYRNKQIMTSSEVYGNMEQQETKTADGYNTQFFTEQKIGKINQIVQNNVQKTFATDDEKAVGVIADFYYTPGENYFESAENVSVGDTIIIQYIPIVEGRQIITNSTEIDRINSLTGRKGIIARYETRNDATTSQELQKIGQSYIKYKGIPEIKLKIETLNNIWNIGDRVQFNAPLEELTTEYMVKSKEINYITTIDNVFYKYTLTSSFNSESDINYFDNQRSKANGNIGAGEYVSRNVDIESVGNIIFYDYSVEEIEITGDNTLNSVLNAPFIN